MKQQINYIHHPNYLCSALRRENDLHINSFDLHIYRPSEIHYLQDTSTMLSLAGNEVHTKDHNKAPTYTDISPHTINKSHLYINAGISPQAVYDIALFADVMLNRGILIAISKSNP